MRLKLISCEIFYREMCLAVARSSNTVDIEFLPKGLHDIGSKGMRERIQAAIDRVEQSRYEAVLLGYGLCNNGIDQIRARALPLVIPRAHDCIAVFMGNRERYKEYFFTHPGVYFKTTGWMERGQIDGDLRQLSIPQLTGMSASYAELIEKYGEDNARYLYETLCNMTRNYNQITYIKMGLESDDAFALRAREEAMTRGWKFEQLQGDLSLIQRLVDGIWDAEDFLVLAPGQRVIARYDEGIISAAPAAA